MWLTRETYSLSEYALWSQKPLCKHGGYRTPLGSCCVFGQEEFEQIVDMRLDPGQMVEVKCIKFTIGDVWEYR